MNKVNLIYGVGDVLHTHVNINPFAEDADGETIIRADVINLDEYVDDAELTELVAEDVVDYIGSDKAEQTINNWVKKIRIGGMVKKNSIEMSSDELNFIITDFKNEIYVTYSGVVPNLFSEGKGVVAEGYLKDKNFFLATKILAKHDENYMPPEVKAALKEE